MAIEQASLISAMKKKILIVAPHGLGDAIMTCQATAELLQHSECYFLVSDRVTSNLIKHITNTPGDKIYILNNNFRISLFKLFRLWFELFKKRFDGSICQYGVSPAQYALLSSFLMIRVRVGWIGRLSSLNSLNLDPGNLHKLDATMMMVKALAAKLKIRLSNFIPVATGARNNVKGDIVLGISSFEDEKHKRWPLSKFSQLCNLIHRDFPGVKIVIIGSAQEKEYGDELLRITGISDLQNACGLYSIEESCDRIRNSALVIANCNAISHIAGYFNVPTIGLYGPTDPSITGPVSKKLISIRTTSSCAPCYSSIFSRGCANPTCMDQIHLANVYQSVRQILISNDKIAASCPSL